MSIPFAQAETGNSGCGIYGCGGSMGTGGNLAGWLLGLLFWIVLIILFLWLARYLTRGDANRSESERRPENQTPLEILDERYARGELDKDEYEKRRQDLIRK